MPMVDGNPDTRQTGLRRGRRRGPLDAGHLRPPVTALVNSGRNCRADCVGYPFTDPVIARQFAGDHLWLLPAMALQVCLIIMLGAVHHRAPDRARPFSLLGLCLVGAGALVLIADYVVHSTGAPLSLDKGQLDGWSLLSQHNPNGVFIALEELGYFLVGLALVLSAQALGDNASLGRQGGDDIAHTCTQFSDDGLPPDAMEHQ